MCQIRATLQNLCCKRFLRQTGIPPPNLTPVKRRKPIRLADSIASITIKNGLMTSRISSLTAANDSFCTLPRFQAVTRTPAVRVWPYRVIARAGKLSAIQHLQRSAISQSSVSHIQVRSDFLRVRSSQVPPIQKQLPRRAAFFSAGILSA